MNPELQKQLMEKLQKQGAIDGAAQSGASSDGVVMGETPDIQPLDSVQNQYIKQHGMSMVDPELIKEGENIQQTEAEVEPAPKEIAPQPLPVQNEILSEPQQPIAQPSQTQPINDVPKSNIADRIREVEAQLGRTPAVTSETVTAKSKSFMDEFGDETFYVMNESNSHCAISDLDISINRGECADLLQLASIEDIKKSRDIRALLAGHTASRKPYLRRLTSEEYLDAIQRQLSNQAQIEKLKAEFAPNQPDQSPGNQRVSPTILSKLEKLRLFSIPENRHQGMPPIEFTQWALTENLTIAEVDYILAHPNVIPYKEIQTALYEKRKTLN